MNTKVFYLFAFSVLSIGFWLYAGSFLNPQAPGWSITLALTTWLLISSLLLAAMRLKHSKWIYTNLFVLAAIPLLPYLLIHFLSDSLSPIGYGLMVVGYPIALLTTMLFYTSSVLKKQQAARTVEDEVSQDERRLFERALIIPVLGALTLVCWASVKFIWGGLRLFMFLDWLIALVLALLSVSALVLAARNIRRNVLILTAAIILALLFLPDSLFLSHSKPQGWELFTSQHAVILLSMYSIALIAVALLLHSGLKLFGEWQNRYVSQDEEYIRQHTFTGKKFLLVFALGLLLLARTLYDFYWFMVWDATTDPLGYFWMFIPVPVILLSGTALSIVLPGTKKLAGFLYSLLVTALMIGVSARAQTVDFRKLTEERAARITQGIDRYFVREGHYPQTLQQLTPGYLLSLSEPVIMYSQGWCYQGGEDFYRLGYLDREHWSSPILFGHVYSAQGHSDLNEDVCQQAIAAFQTQHPDWDQVLRDYGKPTPTPDIGQ